MAINGCHGNVLQLRALFSQRAMKMFCKNRHSDEKTELWQDGLTGTGTVPPPSLAQHHRDSSYTIYGSALYTRQNTTLDNTACSTFSSGWSQVNTGCAAHTRVLIQGGWNRHRGPPLPQKPARILQQKLTLHPQHNTKPHICLRVRLTLAL